MSVASLLVARGFVVSAPPSISVRRLSAILCPRARSGMLCLWKRSVLEKFTRASDFPPTQENGCQRGGTSVRESREKVQVNYAGS